MILTADEIRTMRASAITGGARVFWAIADEVAAETGVPVSAMVAPMRGKLAVNEARQFLCLYAMRRGVTAAQLGAWLGGRDHSTIRHAARQAEAKEAEIMLKNLGKALD